MPHELLSLLVRWVHVAAMAFALGGTLLLWVMASRPGEVEPAEHSRALIGWAENYERFFWLALGLLVMTGVGNLGAFGAGLPAPDTAWGERMSLKLLAVLLLFVLSLLRTLVLIRLGAAPSLGAVRPARLLGSLYGVTAMFLLAIVLLAVMLAHA